MAEDRRKEATATFTPYFWEAYNEVVQPRRFDWYLVERWMSGLGPVGFAIVKALRSRCYWNRTDGVLRDEVEVKMADLAETIGVSEDTLTRQFNTNETLQLFVRRINQYKMQDGKPRKAANIYQVSMDDPIHPDDYERYDELRAQKEADRRETATGQKRITREKPYKPQIAGNSDSYKPQIAGDVPQNAGAYSIPQNAASLEDELPSGGYITSPTPKGDLPPINPPEGEKDTEEGRVWGGVMAILAAQVQNGEIHAPTWHGHLTQLCLKSLTETKTTVQAVIVAPSAFTRDWVEKRQGDRLKAALACVLERDEQSVTIEFQGEGK